MRQDPTATNSRDELLSSWPQVRVLPGAQVLVSGSTVTLRQWPAQAGHRHHRHAGWDAGLHILTVMTEFERDIISQRTREGLTAARSRGRKGCRRPVLTETQLTGAREMCDSNRYTFQQIADAVGCSRITLY